MEWSTVTDWLGSHGVRILIILLMSGAFYLVLRRFVPRAVKVHVARTMKKKRKTEIEKRATTLSRVLVTTGVILIAIAALFMILSEVGINITPVVAGFGIAGIAIGFGAQSLVKDFIAGIFILIENQYSVGDVVRIADIAGIVEEINLRRTILRDLDGIVHSVPNGEIRVASNFTKEWSRVNMNISVGYGEDLDHVMEVLNRIGKEMAEEPYWSELILGAPQVLRVDAFEDSGIAIKILGETQPIKQWEVMGELRRRIKRVFDEEGIEIPWPHTKVYFGSPPPPKAPTEAPAPPRPPGEVLPPDEEGAE
ncbi:MAG: mechanosensitive ion channel family protein [Chloroflexi bacterium]|jgi:small conductance mechanosensitive channel|nr:mechanosensitive ion channel family protein [Chloroflexota bacterium]